MSCVVWSWMLCVNSVNLCLSHVVSVLLEWLDMLSLLLLPLCICCYHCWLLLFDYHVYVILRWLCLVFCCCYFAMGRLSDMCQSFSAVLFLCNVTHAEDWAGWMSVLCTSLQMTNLIWTLHDESNGKVFSLHCICLQCVCCFVHSAVLLWCEWASRLAVELLDTQSVRKCSKQLVAYCLCCSA